MPESEKKKRANKSPRSRPRAGTNDGAADQLSSSGGPDDPEEPEKTAAEGLIQPGLDTNRPDGGTDPEPQEPMGKSIENGATKIHDDQELVDQVITEMITRVTIDSLTEDIANHFCEPLVGNSEFRRRLIDAVMRSERFRSKLSRAIINGLD